MADVTVLPSTSSAFQRSMRKVVFVTADVGYAFSPNNSNDFSYAKTTDGGATWGTPVTVGPADTDIAFDVWFDQWTPGDSGTLIHMWWFGATADDVFYRTLDTADDSLGTQRVVFAGSTAVAGRGAFVSGAKVRSGYLYCAFDIDAGAEKSLMRSTNAGVNWSTLDVGFVEATIDECALFPASNTGDNNDCWAVYHDASADALTLKMWDSSAGSASESSTIATVVEGTTDGQQRPFSGSVRHSDGHLIVAVVTEVDTATSDHRVFDINGTGSITELTAITTNIDDHYGPSVFIDQNTNDIFVAYTGKRDGSETYFTAAKIYYTKSTDDGTTWSAGDTAYMEAAATSVRQVGVPLMGPRFYAVWWDVTNVDVFGNKVNSVTFSSGSPQTVSAAGNVGTAEAFGSPAIEYTISVVGNIAGVEVFGTAGLDFTILNAGAIGTAEIFGSATLLQTGPQTISGAGAIAGAEAFGAAQVEHQVRDVGGIASGEAAGQPTLDLEVSGVGGVASETQFGATAVELGVAGVGAVGGAEAFGTLQLEYTIRNAGGVTSAEAFGATRMVQPGGVQFVSGVGAIGSAETFGTATVRAVQIVIENIGGWVPRTLGRRIRRNKKTGALELEPGPPFPQRIGAVGGIPSGEAFSPIAARPRLALARAGGIGSAEHFGCMPWPIQGAGGIESGMAFGRTIVKRPRPEKDRVAEEERLLGLRPF